MAIDSRDKRLWVTTGNEVAVVEISTLSVVARIPLGSSPTAIVLVGE